MCNVSPVTSHLSGISCHVPPVMCYLPYVIYILFVIKKKLQIGRASLWRVCYQRGLSRLVSYEMHFPVKDLVVALYEVEVKI